MAKGVKAAGRRVKDAGSEEQTQLSGGNEVTKEPTEKELLRMLQPAACRTYVRKRLATEFPGIVDGFVKEAKKGSCNHLKQTIEMLKPKRQSISRRKGPAERLLEKLRRE
jgi:hypothetical protein